MLNVYVIPHVPGSCTHTHTHRHTQTFQILMQAQTYTRTHTQLVLVLPATWYTVLAVVHSPHACKPSGDSNTGGPIGSSGASLILELIFTMARPGYAALIRRVSQQEAIRLVDPLAAVTPALSPQLHGPISTVMYSSLGLQDP